MQKVIVLGGGLVGGPIALDLTGDFKVTVADVNNAALGKLSKKANIEIKLTDLRNQNELRELLSDTDFAINAVPGFMGFRTLEACIMAGVDTIDIAFMPENVMELDEIARKNNVCVISDMGVAPGMSNLLAGYAGTMLDDYQKLEIYVGGLPKVRIWPWEYKAVFSPVDVIEEYTRPARLVRDGKIVVKPALSEPELIDIPVIGTLEAFNSDGLRSLINTLDVPDMVEKTLRYRGHSELMRVLSHAGFFSTQEIKTGNSFVTPLDFTSEILFRQWKLNEFEEDLTVMKVIARGLKSGKETEISWDLYDEYSHSTGIHSMARTTGYAATSALRLVASQKFRQTGVHVPEFIGRLPECVEFMLKEQEKRGVVYKRSVV
ncbi:MAG: saccharopine dehydrogenase [Bacteroidales bacterium]|jgi:saccharopine dehydrogenase-like NADP-dependent oxidoreductase|nr:saccharopine dehydrogenase [Bacteroidales bacterium]